MAQQPNLWGNINTTMMSPLFLGGAALATGEGMGGAMRGMQAGSEFEAQQRKQAEAEQLKAQAQQYFSNPENLKQLPSGMAPLLQAMGPQGLGVAAETLSKNYMSPLETQLKQAQIGKLQREAANGGESPSNVREWEYFNKLAPEQKQQYLTMKRAEKYYDTGTQFVAPNPVDPQGAPRTVDKNVAEKARLEKVGEAQGTAQAALPTVLNASERMLASIDAVDQDPNLGSVTGFVGGRIPKSVQTEGMAETQSKVDQLQGQTFLQAYNDLRGAGQISEREGVAAQAAYNRLMTQTMGTDGYRKALKEFRGEVVKLVDIAKQRAGASDGGNALQGRGGKGFVGAGSETPDPLGIR
jgi:hypothetical protein